MRVTVFSVRVRTHHEIPGESRMFNNFILQAVMKVSFVRMTTAGAKARMTARFLMEASVCVC